MEKPPLNPPHPYRSHLCNQLRQKHIGEDVRLAGWLHKKRNHGQLLFLDLRDQYGITQCVIEGDHDAFSLCDSLPLESVLSVSGTVAQRDVDTINHQLPTGHIELRIASITVLNQAAPLPFQVATIDDAPEELRLRYRFLDLRRCNMQRIMTLRTDIIARIRTLMQAQGFIEIQTPILTASSPEGARDYVVPSRKYVGQFYALPQAPQVFKQLLMVSGFDKYFQIAPCFRDEDARADRSPGEFYQLDMEMAFATQDDVFNALEPVLTDVFQRFSADNTTVSTPPYPRIAYQDALNCYGSDKPDLRNPLRAQDVSVFFQNSSFRLFADAIAKNQYVYAIATPHAAQRGRSWFDACNKWARQQDMQGLGYIFWQDGNPQGPIAKNLETDRLDRMREACLNHNDDALFFICSHPDALYPRIHLVREKLCDDLGLRQQNAYLFCWITDYPMFEKNPENGTIQFSHNPFSMPQGGLKALQTQDPLTIKAWQYDIVCNGTELSSGAIRNHDRTIMEHAFRIAGYDTQTIAKQFPSLWNAFRYGAPPHGGSAPGIDRIVMLLAQTDTIRSVIPFPMNGQAQDVMMHAPNSISSKHLHELHLAIIKNEKEHEQKIPNRHSKEKP